MKIIDSKALKFFVGTVLIIGAIHPIGTATMDRNDPKASRTASSTVSGCEKLTLQRTIYVDGNQCTIGSAVAIADKLGNITIFIVSDQTISAPLTLSGPGVQLVCQNNATLSAGGNGYWILTMTGRNEGLYNCRLSAGNFTRADAVFVSGASNPTLDGNVFVGFGPGTPAIGVIRMNRSIRPVARNNRIIVGADGPVGIFGENDTMDADIESNFVDESLGGSKLASHAIALHSTTAGQTVSGAKVINNTLLDGRGFCVEIGAFGGLGPSRVIVRSNTCTLTEDGAEGGYSLSGIADSSESGNIFDANGHTATIAAYELVQAQNIAVTGNTADIGSAWRSTSAAGATINQSSEVSFAGNVLNGWGETTTRGPSFGLELVSASISQARIENNSVSGNVFIFPKGSESGGVWQQCQAPGSNCSDNNFTGNIFVGDETKSTVGFRIENDLGTTENTLLSANTIAGVQVGILISDADVKGTKIYLNSIRATNSAITDHGSNTLIETGFDPLPSMNRYQFKSN